MKRNKHTERIHELSVVNPDVECFKNDSKWCALPAKNGIEYSKTCETWTPTLQGVPIRIKELTVQKKPETFF